MKLDTGVIWLAAVLLLFAARARAEEPATQPATRPADPAFFLRSDEAGQLVLLPLIEGRVSCGAGRYWDSEGDQQQFDDYRPRCYFSGRVYIHDYGNALEVGGSREVYQDWTVIKFSLTQTARKTFASFTIRTPVGQPDVTVEVADSCTALLIYHNPELVPLLEQVLRGIDEPAYDVGPFVWAQVRGDLAVDPDIAERVGVLIHLCDGPCWRNRERARAALEGMGIDGAKALLGLRRAGGLTAGEALAADVCLARWPVIERREQTNQ